MPMEALPCAIEQSMSQDGYREQVCSLQRRFVSGVGIYAIFCGLRRLSFAVPLCLCLLPPRGDTHPASYFEFSIL